MIEAERGPLSRMASSPNTVPGANVTRRMLRLSDLSTTLACPLVTMKRCDPGSPSLKIKLSFGHATRRRWLTSVSISCGAKSCNSEMHSSAISPPAACGAASRRRSSSVHSIARSMSGKTRPSLFGSPKSASRSMVSLCSDKTSARAMPRRASSASMSARMRAPVESTSLTRRKSRIRYRVLLAVALSISCASRSALPKKSAPCSSATRMDERHDTALRRAALEKSRAEARRPGIDMLHRDHHDYGRQDGARQIGQIGKQHRNDGEDHGCIDQDRDWRARAKGAVGQARADIDSARDAAETGGNRVAEAETDEESVAVNRLVAGLAHESRAQKRVERGDDSERERAGEDRRRDLGEVAVIG